MVIVLAGPLPMIALDIVGASALTLLAVRGNEKEGDAPEMETGEPIWLPSSNSTQINPANFASG